jgi:hypothetical protein
MTTGTPKKWQLRLAESWKGLVALAGAALVFLNTLVGLNFWGERASDWINTGIAGVAAAGVWLARNQKRAEQISGVDIDQDNAEG